MKLPRPSAVVLLPPAGRSTRWCAPAVSRAVDVLVKARLVERTQDPDNRRRLALRLTDRGREELTNVPKAGSGLEMRLERLAHSELRAIERAIEILERAS